MKQNAKYEADSHTLAVVNYENVQPSASIAPCGKTSQTGSSDRDDGTACDIVFEETTNASPETSQNNNDSTNTYTGLIVYENTGGHEMSHREGAYQSLK